MYPSASDRSMPCDDKGKGSSISVRGVGGHEEPSAVEPPVDSCPIVLLEEYEVESGGVGV